MSSSDVRVESAPAKVNLTLRVLRRRNDGYHEIESLVVFAGCGDRLGFSPGGDLALTVRGPSAAATGGGNENLVLKAVRAFAVKRPDLRLGTFDLDKQLPVAAGLGGGSADAAAALRLIADANGVERNDPALYEAARATGADVPVCLDPRPRIMRGIGEVLSSPLSLPRLPAVLVNPGVALATKPVFASWQPAPKVPPRLDDANVRTVASADELLHLLAGQANDLEAPAIVLQPVVAEVLTELRGLSGCKLARMSGSGATCFGLFADVDAAVAAEKRLAARHANWWVKATTLGG